MIDRSIQSRRKLQEMCKEEGGREEISQVTPEDESGFDEGKKAGAR